MRTDPLPKNEQNEKGSRLSWETTGEPDKFHGGVYVGTLRGSDPERRELASALKDLYESLARHVGCKGSYAEINLAVKIVDGTLSICEASEKKSYKPSKQ
jgi:hypothetical protein